MNRIDRLTAILIQLQSKKFVTAHEISNRFEVSLRTIYRDINALEEAGVPLGAEPGKGYFIVEGYHLPPVMFTSEEAIALLMAEKVVARFTDSSVIDNYMSAMYKIKAVLTEDKKQLLEDMQPFIEIQNDSSGMYNDFRNDSLISIQKALAKRKVLKIGYHSIHKDEIVEQRFIEPVGLCFYGMCWHLIGFCRLRNDYRDFRVDRIIDVTILNEQFEYKKLTIRDYFLKLKQDAALNEVGILIPKSKTNMIQSSKFYMGFIDEEIQGDVIQMNFITGDLAYFARWLLSFADEVRVLYPKELNHIFNEIFQNIIKKQKELNFPE